MKLKTLKLTTLLAGIVGAGLMYLLYATGIDEKGLLTRGHWAGIGLWCLTLAVGIFLLAGTRKEIPSSDNSTAAVLGCILAAGAFGMEGATLLSTAANRLDLFLMALHLICAGALIFETFRILKGKPFPYWGNVLICVCFALRMIGRYRLWSSNPQLMDYGFYMLAHVCLMLAAYQLSVRDAGTDNPKKRNFFTLAGAYFCIVCLCGGRDPFFMGAMGLWALTRPSRQEG